MSLSKMSELKELSSDDIEAQIQEVKRQLFDLRFQKATRQTVQPHQFKHARHKLAQLMTLQQARQLETQAPV
jgi:large subunit ribosomal protein L29